MANRALVDFTGKNLSDVTVGVLNEFPYTFPFDFSVEGLRWLGDPDKRTLNDPEV